jgi:hypothetical protein
MERFYRIRIPDKEERVRAMEKVFLPIEALRFRYPNNEMEVTKVHLDALQRENIAFEFVNGKESNDQGTTPGQP